jgi:CRP-like cAMP-binding protein
MGPRRDESACIWDFWALRVDCRACDAGAATPFAVIGSQVLGPLQIRVENFIPPQAIVVVRAGEPADALFTVRKGFLKLWATDHEGHQRVLRLLKPGDMFGLEALLEPRYRLNAETLTPARLCRIPLDVVRDLLKREPLLCTELERRWMHQLQRSDDFVTNIASGPSRGRVVKFLRYLALIAHPEPAPYVSRMDMASMLDISRETAARVIADLKRHRLLEETRSHLLFDPLKLPD